MCLEPSDARIPEEGVVAGGQPLSRQPPRKGKPQAAMTSANSPEFRAAQIDYDEVRPHSSLNLTPKKYSTTVGLA